MKKTMDYDFSSINFKQKAWKFIKDLNSGSSEKLNRIAINDGDCKYTYGVMFNQWEQYASVFSALNITEKNKSRVGVLGSTSAEAIFAFYGLNIVGAEVSYIATFCAFNTKKVIETIKFEKLTDIILTDDFAQPNLIGELITHKEKLGLRNIILLHVPVCGSTVNPIISFGQEYKYVGLNQTLAPICMSNLLLLYGNYPISYSSYESKDSSLILHTSGTTSGTGKPVVLSDEAINNIAKSYSELEGYHFDKSNIICAVTIDLSNSYGFANQVHSLFAFGATLVTVPATTLNPAFCNVIPETKTNLLFSNASIFDMWIKQINDKDLDFSSLKTVIFGGSYTSVKDKKRFLNFLKKHGCKDVSFIVGYGLTELGGACILATEDIDDESIGFPMSGVDYRIYDEENNKYFSSKDAPCKGLLYLNSYAMTNGYIDDVEVFKLIEIDGKKFICTNDIVSVDKEGRLFYLGRNSKFYINDDKVQYDAGLLETTFSKLDGVESCAVVPFFVKIIHDNIPMLTIKFTSKSLDVKYAKELLNKVFIKDKILGESEIPSRLFIVDKMPLNQNGKINKLAITNGSVKGKLYKIETTRIMKKLKSFKLDELKDEEDDMMRVVYKSIAKDIIDSNVPFKGLKEEESYMKQNCNPFAWFEQMNNWGNQMMNQCGQNGFQNKQSSMFNNMAQNFMSGFNQMNQMNQMGQFNQMLSSYANQMYQMNKKLAENMYKQNMEMIEKVNDMVQTGISKTTGKKAKTTTKKTTKKKTAK